VIRNPHAAGVATGLLLVALAALAPSFKKSARHLDQLAVAPSRAELAAATLRLEQELAKQVPGQPLYIENDPSRAVLLLQPLYPRRSYPGSVALFVLTHARDRDRSVFFVERDVELVKWLRQNPNARVARLLVAPEEAEAARAGRAEGSAEAE